MAQRARMIVSGNFAVEKALKENKVKMLIITSDTSEKTIKEYEKTAMEKDIPLKIVLTKEELGKILGKEYRAVAAVLDEGFCKAMLK